jgi:luciferase family oxidoreductase group 1
MPFALSVLDQSPVLSGESPADAVATTIALARHAERLGYTRYWLAEHHAMAGLADASPEVLLARLTAETQRIRLGTGGIMLPHYAPFKVAETFRMLEVLAPGRIDLGLGRAPGGTGLVSAALESRDALAFPAQIEDTIDFLDRTVPADHPLSRLTAMPSGATSPDVWILGSSEYGAMLAAKMGLPYAFAHFIGGDAPGLMQAYRDRFRPSKRNATAHTILALSVIVAPTDAEAEALALPVALWRMRLLRGQVGPIPTIAEAQAYPWTPLERREVALTRQSIAGSPETVRARVERLVEAHGVDEAMIVTIVPDTASRFRSYELLANAFALAAVAA